MVIIKFNNLPILNITTNNIIEKMCIACDQKFPEQS